MLDKTLREEAVRYGIERLNRFFDDLLAGDDEEIIARRARHRRADAAFDVRARFAVEGG